MSNSLSVVIISKNEEDFIGEAVKSAQFANEVIVLDGYSDDRTCEIARKLGAKVFQKEWQGYGVQKNIAVSLASNDWIFVLDSDERITPQLKNEIISTLKAPSFDGYKIARLNCFFGKNIKTCGLYPDYSIRLFSRLKGEFENVPVHESVQIRGNVSILKNHMIHLAYDNVEEFIEKQKKYAKLSTKDKSLVRSLISPCWTFVKLYIFKLGFLDGRHGFLISKIYAKYTFWKYSK
tara:strand:+ start:1577 stop:2281 length:705 start_codon:yes stop_codon:yes gene_type:complete